MTNWPRGGYPSGDKPVSGLKPPPVNITSKAPSSTVETTGADPGPELRPCDSVACEVPWWVAATCEASDALAESDALLKRASEVVAIRGVRIESLRMERDEGRAIIEGLQRVLAQRDATIERMGKVAADTIDLLTKERDEAWRTSHEWRNAFVRATRPTS